MVRKHYSVQDVEERIARASAGAAQGAFTLTVWIDDIGQKARNSRRSLQEGRMRLVRGVFRAA